MKLWMAILGGAAALAGGAWWWKRRGESSAAGESAAEVPAVPETVPQTAAGQAEASLKRGRGGLLTLKQSTGAVPLAPKASAKRIVQERARGVAKSKLRAWIQKGRVATG